MKKIQFGSDLDGKNVPISAKSVVPEWYKKASRFIDGKKEPSLMPSNTPNTAVKGCIPFMDSFLTGYVAVTEQDIQVEIIDSIPYFRWGTSPAPLTFRDQRAISGVPVPAGYYEKHYAWETPFSLKTPAGYSVIISHPLNRFDLPFMTLAGVVDSDTTLATGSLPFFIKDGWEGIIPKGTPYAQIIPFKREAWKSEISEDVAKDAKNNRYVARTFIYGWYKKFAWVKKEYN